MITSKQNLDIPVSEMMEQLVGVTEIISQNRIQQCTLEQNSDNSTSLWERTKIRQTRRETLGRKRVEIRQ